MTQMYRYDNTTEEWRNYSHVLSLMVRAKPGRVYLLDFVKRHRPQRTLLAVILLDVYGKEVKTLPKVGDYIRHKHTRIVDKIVSISGTAYTLNHGGILPFSQLASDYLVAEDTSSSTATADDDCGYRPITMDDVEPIVFNSDGSYTNLRTSGELRHSDIHKTKVDDCFNCQSRAATAEDEIPIEAMRDRINPIHNNDTPQTQEEIEAAYQRHKDFLGMR